MKIVWLDDMEQSSYHSNIPLICSAIWYCAHWQQAWCIWNVHWRNLPSQNRSCPGPTCRRHQNKTLRVRISFQNAPLVLCQFRKTGFVSDASQDQMCKILSSVIACLKIAVVSLMFLLETLAHTSCAEHQKLTLISTSSTNNCYLWNFVSKFTIKANGI